MLVMIGNETCQNLQVASLYPIGKKEIIIPIIMRHTEITNAAPVMAFLEFFPSRRPIPLALVDSVFCNFLQISRVSFCRAKVTSTLKQRNNFLYINKEHYAQYLMILWQNEKDLLAVPEIKQLTGCTSTTIRRWIKDDEVESLNMYRSHYILKTSVISQVVNLSTTDPKRLTRRNSKKLFKCSRICKR